MKAKGDYQDLKPLQVYTRSIYWSVIWPSITSRYSDIHAYIRNIDPTSKDPTPTHDAHPPFIGIASWLTHNHMHTIPQPQHLEQRFNAPRSPGKPLKYLYRRLQ